MHNRNTAQEFQTSKPVGHVGSSVLKKAETVVFIEKEDNIVLPNVSILKTCLSMIYISMLILIGYHLK
jgi:hypothetical protein